MWMSKTPVRSSKIDLKVGKIKIQSLPVAVNIRIPGLGVQSSKTQDEWLADDIPVGEYPAIFTWNNKTLNGIIKVEHLQLTHLFVNMIKGEIEDRNPFSAKQNTYRETGGASMNMGNIEMIFIKGGTFEMGDVFGGGDNDEKPVHTVSVSDFYMSKYEVTQKEWQAVMDANPSYFKNWDDCPVENVSWNDVHEFINKLNARTGKRFRLPTEAEWEYAARSGGKKEKFSGVNVEGLQNLQRSLDDVAWYNDNSGSKTHPVGQKQPNGNGLYDMSGNVWEWCEDWYDENYYKNSPSSNPKGPSSGTYRVLRGGSWGYGAYFLRSSARAGADPVYRDGNYGFRLVSE